jgi:hypothetical protein
MSSVWGARVGGRERGREGGDRNEREIECMKNAKMKKSTIKLKMLVIM